jgi:hypothetical protein
VVVRGQEWGRDMSEKQYGIVPARLNWEPVNFNDPIDAIPAEYRALYVKEYSATFPDDYGSMRQDFSGRIDVSRLSPLGGIYAVGATPSEAIAAFAQSRGVREVEMGEALDGDAEKFDWGYRWTADTTSMKAAGINVPGGCVMTWWK